MARDRSLALGVDIGLDATASRTHSVSPALRMPSYQFSASADFLKAVLVHPSKPAVADNIGR
jgi:hypothetical protein